MALGECYASYMNMIRVVLEPHADGTIHLPLPPGMGPGRVKVVATIEPEAELETWPATKSLRGFGALKGKLSVAADFDEPLDDFAEYTR